MSEGKGSTIGAVWPGFLFRLSFKAWLRRSTLRPTETRCCPSRMTKREWWNVCFMSKTGRLYVPFLPPARRVTSSKAWWKRLVSLISGALTLRHRGDKILGRGRMLGPESCEEVPFSLIHHIIHHSIYFHHPHGMMWWINGKLQVGGHSPLSTALGLFFNLESRLDCRP